MLNFVIQTIKVEMCLTHLADCLIDTYGPLPGNPKLTVWSLLE